MELNRFKQLLESTMGDAKPLIIEQTTASFTTTKQNEFEAGKERMKINPRIKFEATKNPNIVTATELLIQDQGKYVFVYKVSDGFWKPIGRKRLSFYCEQNKFYVEGERIGYDDVLNQLAPNLVKNVCGRTAVVTPSVVTPPSDHVCDTDTTSKLHQGKSYKYCKNGEKYYFIGTAGEFKTKHPNWTEATGKGLESIKKMIGPVFDKM